LEATGRLRKLHTVSAEVWLLRNSPA